MGAAKFKVFDPVKEIQGLKLPWNEEITFGIRRAGCARARKRQQAKARAVQAKVFEHPAEYEELVGFISQAQEMGSGEEGQAAQGDGNARALIARASARLAAMGLTMEELFGAGQLSERELAEDVIEFVRGPLVVDDDGKSQEVTTDLMEQCLQEYPFIAEWVRTESQRLQDEFDRYVEGSRGNSSASSAITSGDAPLPASPASTSSAETGSDVSSGVSSSEVC